MGGRDLLCVGQLQILERVVLAVPVNSRSLIALCSLEQDRRVEGMIREGKVVLLLSSRVGAVVASLYICTRLGIFTSYPDSLA